MEITVHTTGESKPAIRTIKLSQERWDALQRFGETYLGLEGPCRTEVVRWMMDRCIPPTIYDDLEKHPVAKQQKAKTQASDANADPGQMSIFDALEATE